MQIDVPHTVKRHVKLQVYDEKMSGPHPNWLCVMKVERGKLKSDPEKLDQIVLDITQPDLLDQSTKEKLICNEPSNEPLEKRAKNDLTDEWVGKGAWDPNLRLIKIGQDYLQLNVIKGKGKEDDLHKIRICVTFDDTEVLSTNMPIFSDVIYNSDLYHTSLWDVSPKQICNSGEHVLNFIFRKAKMQKHLDFTLVIYDKDNNKMMKVQDHATFANSLVQFLVNFEYFEATPPNRIEIGTNLYVKVFLEGIEADNSYMPIGITNNILCSQCSNDGTLSENKEVAKYKSDENCANKEDKDFMIKRRKQHLKNKYTVVESDGNEYMVFENDGNLTVDGDVTIDVPERNVIVTKPLGNVYRSRSNESISQYFPKRFVIFSAIVMFFSIWNKILENSDM